MAQEYSAEQIAKALIDANGIIATAAKRLGCTRQTVYNYIGKDKTVAAARDEAKETTLDWVESQLMKQIGTGNMTAIIFYLKTQGKGRGYVERLELGVEVTIVQKLITEMEHAGLDPADVFNTMLAKLAHADRE